MAETRSLQITDEDVIYACKVLDALSVAFDHVAAKPKSGPQLAMELSKKSSDIFDALLAVTNPDCRPVVFDLGKSLLRAVKACLESEPKKK